MNITITGNLGSGKTSVCNELKAKGYDIVSAGLIFRDIAAEKGVSVVELNELAKTDKSIDKMLDDRSVELGKTLDNTVFDSRLAWHFIPDSFKVFLTVDTKIAAQRVFAGEARNAETYTSQEDAAAQLKERAVLERERFRKLYQIDYYSPKNYDFIIDSSAMTPEQIADEIIRNFEKFRSGEFHTEEYKDGSLL